MAALQSSFSSFQYRFSYHVFLSFRGTDTRYGFTGNLYKALCDRGIHTFFDDYELQRGEKITPALVKAIQESRIAIPIFSENYACSSFCLDELVHIMESIKVKGQLVLPIFYAVDPSQVRYQNGKYGEALARFEARFTDDKIKNWKMALNQAANLSGYHFKQGDEYEYMFIGKIVEDVSRKIKRAALPIVDYPVGLESQVLRVNLLLDVGSNDGIRMVGIHGPGGIGKTTLALAVYNSIADHFDDLCFLENVRENSRKDGGLIHLQKNLLSELLGEKKIELTSVKQGISIIQYRLQQKKVLLILDDVDEKEQLKTLVGRPDWFGPGSRVIITTRDKQLLACHEIKRTYEVEELNRNDAFQLLTSKAFKSREFNPCYLDAVNRVVTYASGLPLALEVIGSNLFGKSIKEWESAINQYERIPNNQILNVLKVSFDALEEEEKSVFLDIACCFKGYRLEDVEDILCAHHGDNMIYQIGVLVKKSLIKIRSHTGLVTMHDLIEDMGKEIVRQESPKEPGKRSRLWSTQDIVQVLKHDAGSSTIEIIHLDPENKAKVEWNGEAFRKMRNLKTLIIRNGHFSTDPKYLPNSLRALEWWRYPSRYLPSNFHPKELVICKLPDNSFTSLKLLDSSKKLINLKVLNFRSCKYLTQIHDVSGLPNLEELSFRGCGNLVTIHSSVGFLDKLKVLDAYRCAKLRSFPPIKLNSLEHFSIQYCTSLERFPEILGKMENITELDLLGTSIQELPASFQNLNRIQMLRLRPKGKFRLPSCNVIMPELTKIEAYELEQWFSQEHEEGESSTSSSDVVGLNFQDSNLSQKCLTSYLRWFANVQELNMSRNNFTVLPECIKEYRLLRNLILNDCYHLQEIRGLPPNLKYFSARNCESLSTSSRNMLLNQELHEARSMQFFLPGARFPKWFEKQRKNFLQISFWFRNKFPSIILCLVVQPGIYLFRPHITLSINGKKDIYTDRDIQTHPAFNTCHLCLINWTNDIYFQDILKVVLEKGWNRVKIAVKGQGSGRCIDIGMHVIKQETAIQDIRYMS